MIGYILDQLVVSQNLPGLRVYVNLSYLAKTPYGRQGQDHRDTPTQPVVLDHQHGGGSAQASTDFIQQEHIDLASGSNLSHIEPGRDVNGNVHLCRFHLRQHFAELYSHTTPPFPFNSASMISTVSIPSSAISQSQKSD